jgi:DNA-binding transcriptional MerR regulator
MSMVTKYDPLADGPALAKFFGVSPVTVRSWVRRGRLQRRGRDRRGRNLYSVAEAQSLAENAGWKGT